MGKTPRIFAMFSLDLELSCPYFPIYHFPLSTFITSPGFSRRLRVSAKHLESLIINPSAAPQHSARRLSSSPSLQGLGKEENTRSSCYTEPFFAYWWQEPKNCYFSKGFWNLLSVGLTAVQPRMPATHSSVSHRTPASSTACSRNVLDVLLHLRFLIQELLRTDMFYPYRIIAIDC